MKPSRAHRIGPRDATTHGAARKPIADAIGTDRAAVLIVDDASDNLLQLAETLRRDDLEVLTASSGRDALEILREHDVAAAVIDVVMPEMDGFELADRMRGADETRHVPIIFVTGRSRAEYRAFTGYETGAIAFLYKPLDERTLRAKIDVLVTLDRQRRSLDRARQDAERARAETEILLRLAQTTSKSDRADDVYNPALDAVRELFGAERCAILLYGDSDRMRFRAWRGLSPSYREAVDGHSPWAQSDVDAQPILISDVEADETMIAYRAIFAAEKISAIGFVPLVARRQLLGKFMLYWDAPRLFSAHDRSLAQAIAAQIADALDRARLREAQRAPIDTDFWSELKTPLTTLLESARLLTREPREGGAAVTELAQRIVDQGELMSKLLDRLLLDDADRRD